MANLLEKLGHTLGLRESNYYDMMEGATPLWSGPEDYGAWREKMLQNKQPWGMVPLAERQLGHEPDEYDEWYASDWHEEGAKPSGLYTDPRNAGLEGLFAANPELNWQNPSNKMFPWEPNYAAIEMGDKWMEDKMKGEQEIGKRMGIFDASSYYGEQTDPALASNWGGDTMSINVDKLKKLSADIAQERLGADPLNPNEMGVADDVYQDYLDYGILPHEFLHDLPRRKEITSMLPYKLPEEGVNPMVGGDPEIRPEGWEHDIVYNRDPIWWKYHGSRPTTDPSGYVFGNLDEQFALGDKSAMNQMALQRIAKASVTGSKMPSKQSFWNRESYTPPWVTEYKGTPGQQYNVGAERAGPARTYQQNVSPVLMKTQAPPGRPVRGPHFNTGGIVSLVI